MPNTLDSVSGSPETKSKILSLLKKLIPYYKEFGKDLQDLQFYVEDDILGNNQHFLLTISGQRLQIRKDESDKSLMLGKVLVFCEALAKKLPSETEVSETRHIVSSITERSLIPKETLYWRDVNVLLISMASVFDGQEFAEEIKRLRKIIHKWELGTSLYTLEFEWVKLIIKEGDSADKMLLKMVGFIRKIESKHEKEFTLARTHRERAGTHEEKDRQKIWATILAGTVAMKKAFKWSDFWGDIAILKDMIDNYELGYQAGISIKSPWGIDLEIQKGESLDSMAEKLITFISRIQEENRTRFEASTIIDSTVAIAKKEENKFYWTDVLAGIDNIQKFFPEADYPSLVSLQEMIENNELAQGSALLVNIWPAMLSIKKNDSDKEIKNKILVFLWVLKQMANDMEKSEEGDGNLDEPYWRDILSNLKSMEEAYGDNPDYQTLMMTIEFWVLGTVRDFSIIIEGIGLDVKISDSDKVLKQKISGFIKELQANKKVNIDQYAMKKAMERITQSEMENKRVTDMLKAKIAEIAGQERQINDQQSTIRRLEDEIKQLKSSANNRPSPVNQQTYRSFNG